MIIWRLFGVVNSKIKITDEMNMEVRLLYELHYSELYYTVYLIGSLPPFH